MFVLQFTQTDVIRVKGTVAVNWLFVSNFKLCFLKKKLFSTQIVDYDSRGFDSAWYMYGWTSYHYAAKAQSLNGHGRIRYTAVVRPEGRIFISVGQRHSTVNISIRLCEDTGTKSTRCMWPYGCQCRCLGACIYLHSWGYKGATRKQSFRNSCFSYRTWISQFCPFHTFYDGVRGATIYFGSIA